ncbi:acyclic terpene utilization AtuA family protein [Mesorhizobium sp. B4-1-4]|uniref:acyclic terpene utilization AtuA family protein n=1 Tax=Mesorhizobium sp. B4-1-4 TaxID=2589888 RepID=UPI0011291A59|nr:acyclic terpene utilization AtuA family protein [Mesorhizobium sp. B4-1-4]UCI31977.1 DUF1446 domain-containing protein [Mesorhizobium sp. B4-1-4]
MSKPVLIGAAAGFAGDRSDSSGPLIDLLSRSDGPRFLIYETLAERTLALAQKQKQIVPSAGAVPSLERLLRPALRDCARNGIKIVGNFGAANPHAAMDAIAGWMAEDGCGALRIACVSGDNLLDQITDADLAAIDLDNGVPKTQLVAANVYLGAAAIVEALDGGADIVVTGRVADPALALGPLIHAFGWAWNDWDKLAAGTLAGHLLECGPQVSGGYFADPGCKDVPTMDAIGYPVVKVASNGVFEITKPDGTGGLIDRRTVTEQLLYEIHDPAAYFTPDVILDITDVELVDLGAHRVQVSGAKGSPRPNKLKVTVCLDGGQLAEAEISYAGPNALGRAKLAAETILRRMARFAPGLKVRVDAIGQQSVFGSNERSPFSVNGVMCGSEDIRLRFAAMTEDRKVGQLLLDEVGALYCAGPAGGGGVRAHLTPRLASGSCFVERERVNHHVIFRDA